MMFNFHFNGGFIKILHHPKDKYKVLYYSAHTGITRGYNSRLKNEQYAVKKTGKIYG